MSDLSLNPLLRKKYYLYESNIVNLNVDPNSVGGMTTIRNNINANQQSCTTYYNNNNVLNGTKATRIARSSTSPSNTTSYAKNPISFLEGQQYIENKINELTNDIALAKGCDKSSRYTGPNNTGTMLKPICSSKFAIYSDSGYIPTSESQILQIPSIFYKDNSKKSFCQQINDISFAIADLEGIYTTIISENNITSSRYPIDPIDTFDKNQKYQEILNLRNKLDMKLQSLLNKNELNTPFSQNQLQLDSTVYTTVLWTVLATSILYYVFIKI